MLTSTVGEKSSEGVSTFIFSKLASPNEPLPGCKHTLRPMFVPQMSANVREMSARAHFILLYVCVCVCAHSLSELILTAKDTWFFGFVPGVCKGLQVCLAVTTTFQNLSSFSVERATPLGF